MDSSLVEDGEGAEVAGIRDVACSHMMVGLTKA